MSRQPCGLLGYNITHILLPSLNPNFILIYALQVSLDPEHDNTNLKIGPKNTMEIAILNDDDPGKDKMHFQNRK